jgi:hypothetical protein
MSARLRSVELEIVLPGHMAVTDDGNTKFGYCGNCGEAVRLGPVIKCDRCNRLLGLIASFTRRLPMSAYAGIYAQALPHLCFIGIAAFKPRAGGQFCEPTYHVVAVWTEAEVPVECLATA